MSDIDYRIEAAEDEHRPRSYKLLLLGLILIGFVAAYEFYRLETRLSAITQKLAAEQPELAALPDILARVKKLEDSSKAASRAASYATQISSLNDRMKRLELTPLDMKPLTNQSLKAHIQSIEKRLDELEKRPH